jgi:signal transduction histidine kinase
MQSALDVFVIEDDADTRANLEDILGLDSHRIESAGTLQEAFENNRLAEFSCILLDRRLPDGAADDALERLSSLAPNAAIIVVTGYADMDGTIAALRSGVVDYILKPISPDALRGSLARITRLKHAEERALQAERLAAIGHFVTSLAHESRNFLQKISCSAEFLELIDKDNSEALEEIRRIQTAEKGLEHLLEELRQYAAPMKLEKSLISIQSVWRSAWADVTGRQATVEAELHDELDGTNVACQIDVFRFGQVFRNLFENSIAACGQRARVEIHSLREGGALIVTVRDHGPGLNADQQQNVFKPFFTTKAKGTGLGMAITKRIVEAHGGDICVGSRNHGAEFMIRLPQ